MRRTRKWTHLAPEARHLAAKGVSPPAIAEQLGIHRSTVYRWMAGRQLGSREGGVVVPVRAAEAPSPRLEKSGAPDFCWAEAIRGAYALDSTDEQLVQLAAFALSVSQDPRELASVRLAAAGRFQSLVKDLAGRLRPVVEEQPPAPASAPTVRVDPRRLLLPTIQ